MILPGGFVPHGLLPVSLALPGSYGVSELQGIREAGQALAWAVAWARAAGHPLARDRVRPTLRAVKALTTAVHIVAGWGPTTAALTYRHQVTLPVAATVAEAMQPMQRAGWDVSLRHTWRYLHASLPGIDSADTFRRRCEAADPPSVLAVLWRARTEHGFPADAVLDAARALQR